MSYADITFKDPNYIKRWLQYNRLSSAVRLSTNYLNNKDKLSICDFGAGNGELCKLVTKKYINALITCYEPTPELYDEAKLNLLNYKIDLINDINNLSNNTFDIIFCLEVFEHLPPIEINKVFNSFLSILKPNGVVIVGIPIEIGVPALYKGLFRIFRRYGSYDANIKNIINSVVGRPPKIRPLLDIAPGFPYYSAHMGFDYRNFINECELNFTILRTSASPFNLFGSLLMPELNIIMKPLNNY